MWLTNEKTLDQIFRGRSVSFRAAGLKGHDTDRKEVKPLRCALHFDDLTCSRIFIQGIQGLLSFGLLPVAVKD